MSLPICYLLTSCCEGLQPLVTSTNLSGIVGQTIDQVVYPGMSVAVPLEACWSVSILGPSSEGLNLVSYNTVSYTDCATCPDCAPQPIAFSSVTGQSQMAPGAGSHPCYLLTPCTPNPGQLTQAPVITSNNYSQYVGQIIQVSTFQAPLNTVCYVVSESPNCIAPQQIDSNAVITVYDTCASCNPPPIPNCYVLRDCQELATPIVVSTDLSAVAGLVINNIVVPGMNILPTACWSVIYIGYSYGATIVTSYSKGYTDCECCYIQVTPLPPPLPVRVVPDPVVSYNRTNMTQCDIDANIDFSQAYYNQTKKWRFGINTCSWNKDFTVLWVAKQLSDLSFDIDPLYCIAGDNNMTPPFYHSEYNGQYNSLYQPQVPCAPPGWPPSPGPFPTGKFPPYCANCGPNPCTCPGNPPVNNFGKCGCKTIFAGMPCREGEIPQTFILWSDLGVLEWENIGGILTN